MFFDNYVFQCNKKGISPTAAALEMGFHRSEVSRWGKGTTPRRANLLKIASYFGCDIEDLTKNSNKKPPSHNEDGKSDFDDAILDFVHSLPREQLRGILLVLKAPAGLLDALDREEQKE